MITEWKLRAERERSSATWIHPGLDKVRTRQIERLRLRLRGARDGNQSRRRPDTRTENTFGYYSALRNSFEPSAGRSQQREEGADDGTSVWLWINKTSVAFLLQPSSCLRTMILCTWWNFTTKDTLHPSCVTLSRPRVTRDMSRSIVTKPRVWGVSAQVSVLCAGLLMCRPDKSQLLDCVCCCYAACLFGSIFLSSLRIFFPAGGRGRGNIWSWSPDAGERRRREQMGGDRICPQGLLCHSQMY